MKKILALLVGLSSLFVLTSCSQDMFKNETYGIQYSENSAALDGYFADISDSVGLGIRVVEDLSANQSFKLVSTSDGTVRENTDPIDGVPTNGEQYATAVANEDTELVKQMPDGTIEPVEFSNDDSVQDVEIQPIALRVYGEFTLIAFEDPSFRAEDCFQCGPGTEMYNALYTGNVYIIHNSSGKMFSTKNFKLREVVEENIVIIENGEDKTNEQVVEQNITYEYVQFNNPLFFLGEKFVQDVNEKYWDNGHTWAGEASSLASNIHAVNDTLVYTVQNYNMDDYKDNSQEIKYITYDEVANQLVVDSYINNIAILGNDLWNVHIDAETGFLYSMDYNNGNNTLKVFSKENGVYDYEPANSSSWLEMNFWFDGSILFSENDYSAEDRDTNPFFKLNKFGEKVDTNIVFNRPANNNWHEIDPDGNCLVDNTVYGTSGYEWMQNPCDGYYTEGGYQDINGNIYTITWTDGYYENQDNVRFTYVDGYNADQNGKRALYTSNGYKLEDGTVITWVEGDFDSEGIWIDGHYADADGNDYELQWIEGYYVQEGTDTKALETDIITWVDGSSVDQNGKPIIWVSGYNDTNGYVDGYYETSTGEKIEWVGGEYTEVRNGDEYWGYDEGYFDYWEFTSALNMNNITYLSEDKILVQGPSWWNENSDQDRNFMVDITTNSEGEKVYTVSLTDMKYLDELVSGGDNVWYGLSDEKVYKLSVDENGSYVTEDMTGTLAQTVYMIESFDIDADGTLYIKGLNRMGENVTSTLTIDGTVETLTELTVSDIFRIAPIN